jgi:outer membrane protein assembly factor BamB
LDSSTGALVWRHEFPKAKNFSPITFAVQEADGVVLVSGPYRRAYGLDAHTGERLWGPGPMSASTRGSGTVGPVRWRYEDKWYFVSQNQCVEARTGKLCWRLPRNGCMATISGNYLITMGRLPRGYKEGDPVPGLACYRITPEKAELVWDLGEKRITGYWSSGPVVYRGHVYGSSLLDIKDNKYGLQRVDAQYCVELATGDVVGRIGARGDDYSGWLAQDGRVYRPNNMALYRAEPADFRQFDNQANPLSVHGECLTPTLVDGRLFVRCNAGFLTCLDLRKSPFSE